MRPLHRPGLLRASCSLFYFIHTPVLYIYYVHYDCIITLHYVILCDTIVFVIMIMSTFVLIFTIKLMFILHEHDIYNSIQDNTIYITLCSLVVFSYTFLFYTYMTFSFWVATEMPNQASKPTRKPNESEMCTTTV